MEPNSKPDDEVVEPRKRGRPKGSGGGNRAERRWNRELAPKTYTDDDVCEPWEEQYAKWLAMQASRVSPDEEMAAVCVLKGHEIAPTALRRTKKKLGFKQAYQNARAEVNELHLKTARTRATAILPRAIRTHGKAVTALENELDKMALDPKSDALPVIRAAPALLNPFLERTLPRKTETSHHATVIQVNLTPEQARGLTAPIMVIEAEEVKPLELPATV